MNTESWLERHTPRCHVANQLNLHIMHATPEIYAFSIFNVYDSSAGLQAFLRHMRDYVLTLRWAACSRALTL